MANTTKAPVKKRAMSEAEKELRRKKKAKEAKKKKVLRNRIILGVIFIAVFLAALLIFSKGSFFNSTIPETRATETTLTLNDDGSITFEEILDFTTATYDYSKGELEAFVKSQVEDYASAGIGEVVLEKVDISDEACYLRTKYESAAVYADFTGYDAFFGTIERAKIQGFDFALVPEEYLSDSQGECFIIRENVKVCYGKEVSFVSYEGTRITEDGVYISSPDGSADSAPTVYIIFK